jgi:hypothetical protein
MAFDVHLTAWGVLYPVARCVAQRASVPIGQIRGRSMEVPSSKKFCLGFHIPTARGLVCILRGVHANVDVLGT